MISVIALTHDRDKNLDFTMKCWVQQTFKDFELNIFESGNLDSTIEILRKYKNDVKINCWRLHTKYVNKTYALNFLANQSNGEFLLIWDVDLIKSKKCLENCLKTIDNKSFVLECAKYMNSHLTNLVFEKKMSFEQIEKIEKENPEFFSKPGVHVPGQVFLSKTDFLAVGGLDEKMFGWGPEDSDFRDRLLRFGKEQKIEECWSYHLEHSVKNNYQNTSFSSKTTNNKIYLENTEKNIIIVDNSNISWKENQWDQDVKPEKIEI